MEISPKGYVFVWTEWLEHLPIADYRLPGVVLGSVLEAAVRVGVKIWTSPSAPIGAVSITLWTAASATSMYRLLACRLSPRIARRDPLSR